MNQTNDNVRIDLPSPQMDEQLQRELDEALGDKSMDQLLAESATSESAAALEAAAAPAEGSKPARDPSLPELVRGRIVALRGDDVFVEVTGITGKNQGIVPGRQFERAPRVGSIMDFVVDRFDEAEGLLVLSREGAVGRATWDQISKGDLVEARVTGVNKGGLEVELVGNIRGFIPASQVELHHVDDLQAYIGQKFKANVQDVDRKARSVVLSRRHHLEAERRRAQQKIMAEIEVGQVREGKVSRLSEFGAFVDLGGVDGLVHISDLSYSRLAKVEDAVKVGQTVNVKVLKLDKEKNRISLGLKQAQPNPWDGIEGRIKPGTKTSGKVVRLADFGAFIELEPGVEGLLPVSEMSWGRVRHPQEVVKEGDTIALSVLQIEVEKRRLTLSLKHTQTDPWMGAERKFAANSIVEGTVLRGTEFGAFVELEPAVEGLVHISELADRRVNTVDEILKPGMKEKFRVLEVDETNRKIRLSLKQVKNPKPAAAPKPVEEKAPSNYTARSKAKSDSSLKGGMGFNNAMGTGLGNLKL